MWSHKALHSLAPNYILEFISCPPSLCSSHAGLLLFWTLQVHTQLWACTVLFPLRTPFLFSSLFIADSSSLMSQHKYFSPRKNDTATLSKIPAHLIHLKYHTILCDFLHCIWGYLVFSCLYLLIYFSFPTTDDMPLEEQRIGSSYWLLYRKCLERGLIKYYWIQVSAFTG